MRILNAEQMRQADRETIARGVPSLTLMERAGTAVAATIIGRFPCLAPIAVVCGRGNNGGDGLVVARLLHEKGVGCRVWLVGTAATLSPDAREMLSRAIAAGVIVDEIVGDASWQSARLAIDASEVVVDALFGTGARLPITGLAAEIIDGINARRGAVVAVDLPSGLTADSGAVAGPAVRADVTVTFASPKWPLVEAPAAALAGDLVIADIGIPDDVVEALPGRRVMAMSRAAARELMSRRPADSHKGTYGHVLIVAGSVGKTGAAYLAAMAALRSGAGLVTVATPASCLTTLAGMAAEYMTLPLPEAEDGGLADQAVDRVLDAAVDVIAIGPGLGRAASTARVVRQLSTRATVPVVLDADALFACAGDLGAVRGPAGVARIITPHPGEMAHLLGMTTAEVQARRLEVAGTFAAEHRIHVVLKGHRTVIASPEGELAINLTGNPGMATGGTGDVLTGVIAALMAQKDDAGVACRLGVFLHGAAGDVARGQHGEAALIAGDIIAALGFTEQSLTGRGNVLRTSWIPGLPGLADDSP